jgi:PAS domain S-box-containing protein
MKVDRDTEALLSGFADPVILHCMDPGRGPGRIVMCNEKAAEITGYTMEEILKLSISDLGHPVSGFRDMEMSEKLMSGEPVLFERLIVRKDKSVFPVEVHARLIEYMGKNLVLALLRDITLRKRVEEETHLHLMFEQIVSNISSRFVNMPDFQIDEGIERTLREVGEFIGASRGWIFLITEDDRGITLTHEWSSEPAGSEESRIRNLNIEEFPYMVSRLQKLEDVILDTMEELPLDAASERKWFLRIGFNPVFFVPIVSEERLVGVLGFSAENNRNHRWPRQYGYLLRYIAILFYNALSCKEISQKLRLTQFTLDHYSEPVFWLSTPDYRVIDVNPSACTSLDYSKEELLRMSVYDFDPVFKDPDGAFYLELQEVKSRTFEAVHRTKDGREYPVEITANLFEFEGREYLVSFARDISDRKAAEIMLRKSEQEYRNIFENVSDIFFEASLDGKLLNVTPSVERITRYRQKDLIGKPMEVFYYDPSAREPLLKALYEKGEIVDFELDARDIDGSPLACSLNIRIIFDDDGKPERIVGSLSDIRHRKKAEKQIRQLSTALQQSPVSVIITDPDTKILYVNDSFARFSGMSPEQMIGLTPDEITRGQVLLKENKDLWDKVKRGEIWKGELEYVKMDSVKVWLSITVSPVLDEREQAINYVGILEEITERKMAEQSLRKAKEEAEKSDHLKSAFLANMSHEIRTPMNAILGFSSLLKEEGLEKEQRDYYIDIINSKGRDLLRIISDIIDISRIEAGDLYIRTEPVEIYPFLRGIFNEFREDTQVKNRSNLQFRLNLPDPEKKVIVSTDPSRLKQVFVNLIQNALKFTPDGFVEVGFSLQEDKKIRFYVRDTGIGIPDDKKRIIFERFRQIDESHTREYGGTGLGLAICKNLLELNGSELFLSSVVGQGSEFSFSMPFKFTRGHGEIQEMEGTGPGKPDLDLRGKKILIAEDDGSSYIFLETLLNRFSPEIIWAKNGKQAVDILNKNKDFDLVLMDIRMPEMDGMTATRKIRSKFPDLPIIAQTAYAQVTDRNLALKNGCDDYLSKPISPDELIAVLTRYLGPE